MKIVHFSDTHLGFNDLDVLTSDGINQREADFYKAFDDIVKKIEVIKPNYIIHTGDLFHRSSPSNRAISFALEKFNQLNNLNIPIILIAGNHSTPRTIQAKPILSIFNNFQNIFCAYSCKYEKFEFKDIVFHTIAHLNDENSIYKHLETLENSISKTKKNIMMLHCSVGASFLMSEFGEFVYPKEKEYLFEKMDYVALGHWHGFSKVGKFNNVYYSGSSERTSLGDKRNNKGFILADLTKELKVEFHKIKIRDFISFEIDALTFDEQLNKIEPEKYKGFIIEIIIKNLTALKSIDISNQQLKQYFNQALQVVVKREFIKEENQVFEDIQAISLKDYFTEFLENSCSSEEFNRLKLKADELFAKYEENYDDSI
ncbi:exonuclease sbcCD subunit D [Malaciobacter mytili LMG 24559]|uniref:Exonuclease sbcCD subunit D n=1 Tax=Malaciobacter mytili LMG 24559 TaxID=1032238 RepID=A0AAX2AEC5_9BACT|nr:DNA repair exonuclease [Malaciobacter mytili]AXH15567.1 SbcCD-like exonuclease, nuclease subunit [Malaciobacter mytili LMG 24559]RXK13748.1 exonuclease sbcCD subunit D [Malaciobacter mytili LMG 24559]